MRQHLLAVVLFSVLAGNGLADSWIFQPSTYSHDPQTGERVEQYAAKPPAYGPSDPTYEQSAYIHKRTALRGANGSIERRHYVETWGEGEAIRPYGEWQRPFRAGATPYGPWGNPSGPWTTPFQSWENPYGLGKLPTPPWYPWFPRSGYPNNAYRGQGYPDGGYSRGNYPGQGPGYGYPGQGYPGYGYPPHGGEPVGNPHAGQGGAIGQPGRPGGMQGHAGPAESGRQGQAPASGEYATGPQPAYPGTPQVTQ